MPTKKPLEDMTEPELRDLMNRVARAVDSTLKEATGQRSMFVCVVFNDPKMAQYVSNCQRSDIIKAMRETADRLERKEDLS
jgi:hypothetical protein